MSVKIYVEGGGDRGELKTRCRKGFGALFQKTCLQGRMPKVVACGSRRRAFDRFCAALAKATNDDFVVLLVDSEAPVSRNAGPWQHLKSRDNWDQPADALDDNSHLMVQCMEAWFLADKEALAAYFGDGFNPNALPGRLEIEQVSKSEVEKGLKMASRQSKKGRYDKGSHSFGILAELDPRKVTDASPHAKRLISTLLSRTS